MQSIDQKLYGTYKIIVTMTTTLCTPYTYFVIDLCEQDFLAISFGLSVTLYAL